MQIRIKLPTARPPGADPADGLATRPLRTLRARLSPVPGAGSETAPRRPKAEVRPTQPRQVCTPTQMPLSRLPADAVFERVERHEGVAGSMCGRVSV